MRIVFYCQEFSPANKSNYLSVGASGTVSAVVLASHGLTQLGHNVTVLNRSESGNYEGTQYLKTTSQEDVIESLKGFDEVDVFVANGWAADIFLKHQVKAKKRVYWIHNFIDQKPFVNLIKQGRLDYIFCISVNQLGTWYRTPIFSKITQIYNCIDTSVIEAIPELPQKEKKLMVIGAPRQSKGFHDALRVFDQFSRRNPGYTLYVAGAASLHGSATTLSDNGIFEKEYEETYLRPFLANQDGYPRKDLVLLGNISRKEVLEHLGTTRVALQNPSWVSEPEVHSVAALEVQAMGVPVVSTFRGGQPEVIKDGITGILAKRKSDECLVSALEQIVRNDQLAERMSSAAKSHVMNNFTVQKIALDWECALAIVIEGKNFRGNYYRSIRSKIRHKLFW